MSAVLPAVLAGLSGLGGFFANRPQTTTSSSTASGSQTSTPNFDPASLALRNNLIRNYLQQLQPNNLDLSGYEANSAEAINKNRQLQMQQMREQLAARGITGPAAELAIQNVNNDRFSDITQLHNSIPLLRQQLTSQIMQNAGQFFSGIPYGQTGTSNQTQQGTQTSPGNQLGGLIGGAAAPLSYFYGQGSFGKPANSGIGTLNPSRTYNI